MRAEPALPSRTPAHGSPQPAAGIDMTEFDLIARIRRRAGQRADVALGIGDDAALLRPPSGQALAVATDTLNEGVHFLRDAAPADIGFKALAVNLSDLAAMAAEPAWCTLSLSLPDPDPAWLDGFLDGFLMLAGQHRVALVGGDTTRGPLSLSVTVLGFVPEAQSPRRAGARVGDDIWVTGTLGDAALALADSSTEPAVNLPVGAADSHTDADVDYLRQRLHRPTPRVAAGLALRGLAKAMIDVSDGLLADLGHILEESGVGAELAIEALPASPALAARVQGETRWRLQLAGGDDYELCFSAAADRRAEIESALRACDLPVARIGRIVVGSGLRALAPDGREWRPGHAGYNHFPGTPS